jgi:hypothetical protein
MGFKPGYDPNRNTNGRPKKSEALSDLLQEYGNKKYKNTRKTNNEALVEKLYELALKGDRESAKYVMDRHLGKPSQRVEQDIQITEIPEVIEVTSEITDLYPTQDSDSSEE